MTHNDGNRDATAEKAKILLVQQHLPTVMSLVALLTQGGCEVEVATNDKGAMEKSEDHRFDLIALDLDLAEGGFEAFVCLRQVPALSRTPIIFIARRLDDANWRRGLELGAADYIEKPLDGTAFMRRMLSHVKNTPSLEKTP